MASRKSTPIWGEAGTSSAGSTLTEEQQRFTIFKNGDDGLPEAVTLAVDDIVEITDVVSYGGASATQLSVFSGADNAVDANELLWKVAHIAAASGCVAKRFKIPARCIVGTYPKLFSLVAIGHNACFKGNLLSVRV